MSTVIINMFMVIYPYEAHRNIRILRESGDTIIVINFSRLI